MKGHSTNLRNMSKIDLVVDPLAHAHSNHKKTSLSQVSKKGYGDLVS